jgi:WD40 repeat protein
MKTLELLKWWPRMTVLSLTTLMCLESSGARAPVEPFTPNNLVVTGTSRLESLKGKRQFTARSRDGKWQVSATKEGRLKLCRVFDGAPLSTFYHCSPTAAVFSRDASTLVSAGFNACSGARTIKLWRVSDGKLLWSARSTGQVRSLSFSRNSSKIFARGEDRLVTTLNAADGKLPPAPRGYLKAARQ